MSEERERPIGVFDSGLGGLTVVRAIRQLMPGEEILYFGDTARVPYGTKSPETVTRFARECFTFLARRNIKLLVVACNTASAIALPVLTSRTPVPVVGVILPGVSAALRVTRKRSIGVVGTEATIGSRAYARALHERDAGLRVEQQACPLFVPLAEEGWVEGKVPELAAQRYLQPLLESGIDALILGCTHYPMLKSVIARVTGPQIHLVDSAEETAAQTRQTLAEMKATNPRSTGGRCHVFVSDAAQRFAEIGGAFLGEPLGSITTIDQGDLPWYER